MSLMVSLSVGALSQVDALSIARPYATQPPGTPALSLYEQAMTRVLPEYVEDSLLLKKPSGQHHYGKQVDGFHTSLTVGSVARGLRHVCELVRRRGQLRSEPNVPVTDWIGITNT